MNRLFKTSLIVLVCVLLCGVPAAMGAQNPVISSASVDFAASQITINGVGFLGPNGKSLPVVLLETEVLSILGTPTDTLIVAQLPANFDPAAVNGKPPGTYLLTVSVGDKNGQFDSFDLAIGIGADGSAVHTKTLTLQSPGFTSLLSLTLGSEVAAGGRIYYTIIATDGGNQIATESGIIQYLATKNSITCTVQPNDKLHLGLVNSGCTPGFFNPGEQPGISIFDDVSFSSPAPIVVHKVYFTVQNVSKATIRFEP